MVSFSCDNSLNIASTSYVDCVANTISGSLQAQIDGFSGASSEFENKRSIYLNGVNQWLEREAVSSNALGAGVDLTINGWVKISDSPGDNCSPVQFLGGESAGQRVRLLLMEPNHGTTPGMMYYDAGAGTSHNTVNSTWSFNDWFMVSLHINNSEYKFYKNGALLTNAFTDDAYDIEANLTASFRLGGSEDCMGGWLRHFSIHQGNLNTTQLLAMYNSGEAIDLRVNQGDYTSSSSLLHYWFCGDDDDLGPQGIRDRVGSLHLTASGSPLIALDTPHR